MPDNLRALEHPLRETLRRRLQRGKIDCTLRAEPITDQQHLELNRPLLLQLLGLIEQLRRDAPEIGHPNPMDLLRWPGVLGETRAADGETLRPAIAGLFEQALDELLEHRRREGELLSTAVQQRLAGIEALVTQLRASADGIAKPIAAAATRARGKTSPWN